MIATALAIVGCGSGAASHTQRVARETPKPAHHKKKAHHHKKKHHKKKHHHRKHRKK